MPKVQSGSVERRSKRQEDDAKKKQREADEAAAQKRLEEERAALEKQVREEAKKARAAERASDEDKAKAARQHAEESKRLYDEARKKAQETIAAAQQAEAAKEAAENEATGMELDAAGDKVDAPSDDINVLLSDLNNTTDDDMKDIEADIDLTKEVDSEDSDDDFLQSPEKKKTKKDKKERKAAKKAAKKEAKEKARAGVAAGKAQNTDGPASILKQGRVSSGVRIAAARKRHVHQFHRQIVETSIVLDAPGGRQARIAQFTKAIKALVQNCQLIDPFFQIEPRDVPSTKDPIFAPEGISENHAVLSFHVRTSGGSDSFDMQKPRKNDKKNGARRRNQNGYDSNDEEQDLVFPQVYFNFACSSDVEPQELFDCVGVEWGRYGGARVYLKAFTTFETETVCMVMKSWNRLSSDTFVSEFNTMFQETKDLMALQARENHTAYTDYGLPIPTMRTRLMNPKLMGQDTSQFSGWSTSKAFKRKAIHVEAEKKWFKHIQEVVSVMKSAGIVTKYWGKNAHISNIERDKDNRIVILPGELQKLSSMARDHVNFNASMTSNVLTGVVKLDKYFSFQDAANPDKEAGQVSLRHLLYNYVYMPDGHTLFVELHQRTPVSDVEVIIPYTPQAKEMLEEMNKNPAAYLYHYLQEHKIPEAFLIEVIKGSFDPLLCQQIRQSKWNAVTKKLILAQDKEAEAAKALTEAAWYKDEFGSHMKEKQRQAPEAFADEDFLYDHDGDKSVKTIHSKKGSKVYQGSPDAPTFSLGRPQEVNGVGNDDVPDDISAISEMSKEQLVAMCKSLKIAQSKISQQKGSPPDISNKKASGVASRDGSASKKAEGTTSSSSSSGSSSSSDTTSQGSSNSGTTKAGPTSTTNKGGSDKSSQASKGE